MKHKMNIFSLEFLNELKQCLAYLAHKTKGPACLITVSEIPKVFSAGLDLKILLNSKRRKESRMMAASYFELIMMMLALPMITVG